MSNQIDATTRTKVENNVVLISKLEEPLFITYVAKKTFANAVFKNIKKDSQTKLN